MYRFRLILALFVLFALAACGGSNGLSPNKEVSKVKPMPIDANAYGKSYGEWASAWTIWAQSIAAGTPEDHPLWDTTGEMAAKGQSGKVWFLGAPQWWGGSAERTVTIPSGKALFFPLVQVFQADWVGWGDNWDPPHTSPTYGFTFEELSTWAHEYLPADLVTEMHATLDGNDLADDYFEYVTESPYPYTAVVPEINNIWRWNGNVLVPGLDWPTTEIYPCLTYGYWLLLPPLSAGEHELNFGTTIANPDNPDEIWYQNDVIYHLTIKR